MSTIEAADEDEEDDEEAAEETEAEKAARPGPTGGARRPRAGRPPRPASVGRSLASLPALARQLAARTWQMVRFPTPVLLTSDTPVVLWAPSAATKLYQVGLGSAHEVRSRSMPATR